MNRRKGYDYLADRESNKRTLVVRFGRKRASRIFVFVISVAFVMLLAAPLFTSSAPAVWLGFGGLRSRLSPPPAF